jgi:hypothetical protein
MCATDTWPAPTGAGHDRSEDWWRSLDDEVLDCLADGPASAADIGRRLGMSEAAATSLIFMLAGEGKVRIARVELGRAHALVVAA